MKERRKGRVGVSEDCPRIYLELDVGEHTGDLPQSTGFPMTATDLRLRLQISQRMRVQASSPYDRGKQSASNLRGSIPCRSLCNTDD